jgi:hypothetical protein
MTVSRRHQVPVAYIGLVLGSSIVFLYFLGWQIGVPVAFVGVGSALLFYDILRTNKKGCSPSKE